MAHTEQAISLGTKESDFLQPSKWVTSWAHLIQKCPTLVGQDTTEILDLACGTGRHMKWLYEQGFSVLGVDIDEDSLNKCRAFGQVLQFDLEQDAIESFDESNLRNFGAQSKQSLTPKMNASESNSNANLNSKSIPWPLEGQHFNGVIVTNYLWRPLWPHILGSLGVNGVLIYETFSEGNETVGRPRRPEFLLRTGELLEICSNLRIVAFEEVFLEAPSRFVQRIVAVKASKEVSKPWIYRATSR